MTKHSPGPAMTVGNMRKMGVQRLKWRLIVSRSSHTFHPFANWRH
jgi:uncharacterized protein YodC (DUF2158 family)